MLSDPAQPVKLPDDIASRVAALPSVYPASILAWLDYLHDSRTGWLEIGTRTADQLDFTSLWFQWPADRLLAMHLVASKARDHDVWVGCLLKSEPRRGTELPGRFAWCDNDLKKATPAATPETEALGAAVVGSGTPGNRQVWVALDEPATPAVLRQINKALIARIGGDAKHSPDSIMRIPGTLNHKPCFDELEGTVAHVCNPVWLICQAEASHAPGDLTFSAPSAFTEDTGTASGLPDVIDIGEPPDKLKAAFRAHADDPSEHTQYVAYVAASMFREPGEILAALEQDQITSQRRNERRHSQPDWWPAEFSRVLTNARAKYPVELAGKTIPAMLVNLATTHFSFGVASDGEPFALPRQGSQVVRMLRGDKYSLRNELARRYSDATGNPPGSGALTDALTVLEGICQESEPVELPLRVARYEDGLVLDLGDNTGRAVVLRPGHWEVTETSPVLFRRTRLTAALPVPEGGKKLTEVLFPLLNIPRPDWSLMAAILVSMLWPDIPHPIPLLTGAEGVAKTSTTRVLRSLVDPSAVPIRGRPEEKDWDIAMAAQWVVALDNLSEIKPWLSDALCRAVTGEGGVKRKLYTDADMSLISARRVMMLNGISVIPSNADLAGRTITFELEPVSQYRKETNLAADWAHAHPYALGALLDQAAAVLPLLPGIEVGPIFRMADFAAILIAMDQVNGTSAVERYREILERAAEDVINSDLVAPVLLAWARRLTTPWTGTLKQLSEVLIAFSGGKVVGWPATEVAFLNKMRRISNPLRRSGVIVERGQRTNKARNWVVTRDDLA